MGLLNLGKKVVNNVGTSGKGLAALGLAAGAAGFFNSAVGTAQDAFTDVALGSPDADKYFTGKEVNARFLVGAQMGGLGGGLLQATSPSSMATYGGGAGAKTAVAGGIIGGAAGAFVTGGLGGAMVGGAIGGMAAPLAATAGVIHRNPEFFGQSAYGRRSSSNTAASLNAVGDIVFGMHNSRNGY